MTVDGCPFDIAGADCFVVLCVCAPRNAREDLYFRFVEEYQAKLVLFVLRNARQPAYIRFAKGKTSKPAVSAPRNAPEDLYIRFVEKVTVKRTKSAHFVLSTGILPFKSTNTGVSVLSEFAPPKRTCSFALS